MTNTQHIQRFREIMAANEVLRRDRRQLNALRYGHPYEGFLRPLDERQRLWLANEKRQRLLAKRIAFTLRRIEQRTKR